ncbi:hypothetical protein [Caballeronia sordidicola]|uniref:NB-ARC domain-containing protein n=1 Tax=Caballeronia sordidicola TaxID=196367 RepID=A0A242N9I6_CABSO|nr:hypothetical protein [Caballeronia sordidicola]OTP80094.1 hypothetical protein PAMC26510_03810 [Caballeronia sordidicola]
MSHLAISQIFERVESASEDSDFNHFFSLLLAAEALFKILTLGMLSAVSDDDARNRYRLEHSLARADGIGEWGKALEDALSGPASQYLLTEARIEQAQFTKICSQESWQHKAVIELKAALIALDITAEDVPAKTDLKRWFRLFSTLRNKTRGHGATSTSKAKKAAPHLQESIDAIYKNASLLTRPWIHLHRNYSGKYRVQKISGDVSSLDYLKKESHHSFYNGIYILFGDLRRVPLFKAGDELRDFFFANGGLSNKRYEMLSYLSDDKIGGDASEYSIPPGTLPASETDGHGELEVRQNCLSNAPDPLEDYVSRPALEEQLGELLLDNRRPIITLVGSGGIGKTSLSLSLIEKIYSQNRFATVIWLSARDIDLTLTGPKSVRASVLSPDEMGRRYAELVLPKEKVLEKGFQPRVFFEQQLERNELGPCLYVFDNFETTQNPIEVFNWIDTFLRLPNKALITTRLRDFKGDYPVDIGGMTDGEARQLINRTCVFLKISDIEEGYINEILETSERHPYVIKILLGEYARTGKRSNVGQLLAGNDQLLTALFERTYASLSPCAQRSFLTLSAWNSSVPKVALEAVLMRSTAERQEVEKGVEALLQYSMAELHAATTDGEMFVRLPKVASAFGKKKLFINPLRDSILSDVEILKMLGPSRNDDVRLGLAFKLEKFISNIAQRVDAGEAFEDYAPIVEMICRAYPPGWLMLARWHYENGSDNDLNQSKIELTRFLEQQPAGDTVDEAWQLLANVCFRLHDTIGEIHARIARAQIPSVPFWEVSNAANRLNSLHRDPALAGDPELSRSFALRLLEILDRRRGEASADDLSRMAWVALHADQRVRAIEFTELGLRIEPDNTHCIGLSERLGITT